MNTQRLSSAVLCLALLPGMLQADFQTAAGTRAASDTPPQEAQQHSERGYILANSGDLEHATAEFRAAVQLAPTNPQYLYALGIVLAKDRKLEQAVGYFRAAAKRDPTNLVIRQSLAAAEWQLGMLVGAEKDLRFILRQKPTDQSASFLLGMVLENAGHYANAAELLARAQDQLKVHPESVAALLHCYYETAKLVDARDLEDGLLRDASQVQAIFMGAGVAAAAGDYSSAERMLLAVRDSYSPSAEVDYQFAVLRYRTGNYSEAEAMLDRLIAQTGEASKYFNLLAWCLAKQEKTREAVNAFDRAIDLEPRKASNYVDLATVLMGADLLVPALEAVNKAIEVEPDSYAAYHSKGLVQLKQHDYMAAVDSYSKAVELNRSAPEPLMDLAEAEAAAGEFDKASTVLEKSIRKYPQQTQFYYQYALLLLHHSGSFDQMTSQLKAVDLLQRALALDDSIAGAHYELGNIWLNQEKAAKALPELQRAEKLKPSDENTHYALSLALRKLGRPQDAENERQIFVKLKAEHNNSRQ